MGHGLRVFENRELGKTFGSQMVEVTADCREIYTKELHDLYSLPNICIVIEGRDRVGHAAHTGEWRNTYWVLVGKPLTRPRYKW